MPDDAENTRSSVDSWSLSWIFKDDDPGVKPELPQQVGKYVVHGVLGRGGCGVVLKALNPDTDSFVAVKLVLPKLCTPDGLRRFDVEWRTVLALKHRCIASVNDSGWFKDIGGDAPFYVMELLTDGSGGRALDIVAFARARQLTLEERVELMAEICGAVQTAHDKGVIHRDLKPGNIPVDEADRSFDKGRRRLGVPKVVDFGLAHVLGAAIVSPEAATPEYQFAGTLRYMAPERGIL